MTDSTIDIISLAISLTVIVSYHLYLRAQLRRNPVYTIQAVNADARASWVGKIMKDPAREILAVQTLRNATMAATFLASTSILLIMGVLNLLQNADGLGSIFSTLHSDSFGRRLGELKLLLLLVDFFWAFFCFSLAVRMYNHMGFLINSSDRDTFCPAPQYVVRLLNRSGRYYSLGMRAYYLSVPLVFWLFGPYYLLAASVGIVVVLYHIDRAPEVGTPRTMGPSNRIPEKGTEVQPREIGSGSALHRRTGSAWKATDQVH